ncbi:MAG TPA: hypothetical protein VMU89_22140 [Thermomicrobiaceae bacterium]|nr:hypothetical protein [Thermomicrobiaceae bacterium]
MLAVTAALIALLAAAAWVRAAALPELANHYEFALPGSAGLPFRVSYAGRHYENTATCAGAGWCRQARANRQTCWSAGELSALGRLPAPRADSIPTLLGASHALLADPVADGRVPTGVVVTNGDDCYVPYTLEGGP